MHTWLQYIKTNNAFARRDYLLLVVSLVYWLAVWRRVFIPWGHHPDWLGSAAGFVIYSILILGPSIYWNRWITNCSCVHVGSTLGRYVVYLTHDTERPFLSDGPTMVAMILFGIVLVFDPMVRERNVRQQRQPSG